MNRKTFLTNSLGAAGLLSLTSFLPTAFENELDPVLVKDFVSAGHTDLDAVKSMLKDEPNLLSARYDWGYGDYEEAIEGAGHMGNQEIAEYLIDQGARVNLFQLTMLGEDKLVIPILERYPSLIQSPGPHGFTLLHHANVGKAVIMQEYLASKGLAKTKFDIGR